MCLLPPEHWLRRSLARVIFHRHFDNGILLLIFFSSLVLALDSPLQDPNSTFTTVLVWVDGTITVLFLLECVLKIVVLGLIANKVRNRALFCIFTLTVVPQ